MKIILVLNKIMEIIQIIEFQLTIMKIMKILKLQKRIKKFMKILEFHKGVIKKSRKSENIIKES